MNRVEEFEKITQEMLDIYKRKNSNYGNSFGETFEKLGIISAVTRLMDKMNRVVALSQGDENNFESLDDTLLDLANYAIMTRIEMRIQEEKNTTEAADEYEEYKSVIYNLLGKVSPDWKQATNEEKEDAVKRAYEMLNNPEEFAKRLEEVNNIWNSK